MSDARSHVYNSLFLDNAAFGACLARVSRVNLDQLATGSCCLITEHRDEATPRCVVYLLRQHTAGESLDVQFLNRNDAKAARQCGDDLVQAGFP
jgi:hypothetical protein